ncbi:hypothetical protein TNCV_3523841 [Trichonephila clavipes]|uniref:Uncharacterized protein n=1 Tax=Trichonephila clavipes TaxID=2585209 RepID=A0A8X6SGG1_TRICX|nr:hypothetical protein TNCV_3523841 [Trichonephila clavipes]
MDPIYTIFTPNTVVSSGQSDLNPSSPPRSPDLSVCDYFLWGTFKSKVCACIATKLSLQELQEDIFMIRLQSSFATC